MAKRMLAAAGSSKWCSVSRCVSPEPPTDSCELCDFASACVKPFSVKMQIMRLYSRNYEVALIYMKLNVLFRPLLFFLN